MATAMLLSLMVVGFGAGAAVGFGRLCEREPLVLVGVILVTFFLLFSTLFYVLGGR